MQNTAFKLYAQEHGGRVLLLILLFLVAIYEFYSAGFPAFAVICIIPLLVLFVIGSFKYRMLLFWILVIYNYFVQMKDFPSFPGPMSLPPEMMQLALIAIALIDVEKSHFERIWNPMFLSLIAWALFCTLEVLNDTCDLGIDVGAWYTGARMMAFQLVYIYLVFILYISNHKLLTSYLYVWGALALFAVFWVWKQQYIGLTHIEHSFLYGAGGRTHLLQAGTLIRYWSIYSDAANYGIGIASTGVAFVIFGITARIKKLRYFFLIVGGACIWGMFPSGTRTAMASMLAGFITYIFLSKSFKIAIPFTIIFCVFAFLLAFTNIGQGNQQIRRMRSVFDKNDASSDLRSINKRTMQKYLKEAPWGIGIGMARENVPANNKYKLMSYIPPDSEHVFIWIHTGIIGITTFAICSFIMLFGACWIVFFTLKNPSLRGIGAGMCCAFVSQQLGAYANQVLMQFPNCLVFYGGLTIVYVLPWIEKEWIEWESKGLAIQEEKKRLKLEKKLVLRV